MNLDWRDKIKEGDVLRSRGGDLRVVREATYWKKNGQEYLHCVTFAIRRCSWTTRCTTTYSRTDLKTMGYTTTKAKYTFKSRMDKAIARDLLYRNRFNQKLNCCDVEGVP